MNAPPIPPRETCFSISASRALQRAFAPITKESFATYLFSPTPRIPSKSFSNSVVVHVSQKFTHSGLSDPRRAFRAPTLVYSPTTESATINLVLTPLKREENTLLGVVSIGGVVPSESVLPFSDALKDRIQRGRFVYDLQERQMVSIMDGMSNDMLCVVSARWFGDGASREKFFFGVPKREYSFYDMPKRAIVVLSNVEYRVSKTHGAEGTSDCGTAETDPLFGNFTEEQTQTALGVRQRDDSFDMSAMTAAVENLATRLSGLYYGPKFKRDIINISTGELSSRCSGKMVVRLTIPDHADQCRIRRMVAQDYFLQLLPPGSERWFLQSDDEQDLGNAIDDIWGNDDFIVEKTVVGVGNPLPDIYHLDSVVGNSSETDVTRDTSTPDGEPLLMSNTAMTNMAMTNMSMTNMSMTNVAMTNMVTPLPVQEPLASREEQGLTEAELKKRKDEERRKRNRLSAARSNERRREREKAQRKELELLKAKKILLEGVQQRLIDENDALRERTEMLD